jgi:biofilm PGA synthesis N-glycosyltransferase PgaC
MRVLTLITAFSLAVVAYHYLGYPLVLAVWAWLRHRPVARREISARVSLIVSAYDEESVIASKIDNSLEIDYPDLEVIVVSDGSEDRTPEIVSEYQERGVISMHQPQRRGKGAAMNRAAERATGEVLVFSDANAFYAPDALRALVRNFADPAVGCVSGRKSVVARSGSHRKPAIGVAEGTYWRYESFIKLRESEIDSTVTVVGEMLALRREIFTPIPPDVINDDAFLGLDVLNRGYRVIYEPEATCWEEATSGARDDLVRRRRMTAGRWQLLFRPRWLPWPRPAALFQLLSHKVLRLLLPVFMLAALIANTSAVVATGTPTWLWATWTAQVAFYGLALLGWLGEVSGRSWKPVALPFFILNGNLGSLLGLLSYARGRQGVLWRKARR